MHINLLISNLPNDTFSQFKVAVSEFYEDTTGSPVQSKSSASKVCEEVCIKYIYKLYSLK